MCKFIGNDITPTTTITTIASKTLSPNVYWLLSLYQKLFWIILDPLITLILTQLYELINIIPFLQIKKKKKTRHKTFSVPFSSVAQSCPTPCNSMNHSTPGLPVHHQLLESTHTHVHQVGDTIQPSHPLSSPSPPALNLSQHQGLFQWVSSSHQVAKILEFQLQHQSFQWTPRTDLL